MFLAVHAPAVHAQGLGGAGTVQGTVKDPTGGVMQAVQVRISNPVTGFSRTVTTDTTGRYVFSNLPPNPYHIIVDVQGFQTMERDVDVRTGVPITMDLTLALAGATSAVEVVGHAGDLLERDPTAHTDIDQSLIAKLPLETSSSALNQVVTMASPGVVSDSNGFFHPIGDHAQTQFSIDNQPITDQQSRLYSNQISEEAVQSLEVITGVAPAEYGEKSSLVVHIVTKSGLDQSKPTGSASFGYGSFSSPTGDLNIGAGSHKVGNFLSVTGLRTDRFLDPPELEAFHDTGHQASFFDRFDVRPSEKDTIHLNLQTAKSGFDVPNTYDQIDQDQHQDITTFNIAPGYSRVIGSNTLFTANGFVRRDHLTYLPSPNPLNDIPASVSQDRTLTNTGVKADVSMTLGVNNVKFGGSVSSTKLHEQFTLGITDPTDEAFAGEDGSFNPDLAPFDLTSGGSPFAYDQSFTIKQQAAYVQDDIKAGAATLNLGLRLDHYDGLTSSTLLQPRLGVSYAIAGSGTVLRASYGRTMETPYNENLLLSAGYGLNGLFGETQPVPPGKRHQVEIGIQQGFGKWLVADFGYFNKRTDNGYDFGVLFNTPIAFPVAWNHSKIDGFTGRLNLVEHNGFSAFVVLAHTNAIYSPPGVGGLLSEQPEGDFRIDHDQKFNSTTNVQYTFEKRTGSWAALSWRYDSGLVAGAVASLEDALALTGDQQAAIGFFCGSQVATRDVPLTGAQCTTSNYGATRLRIPAEGTADDVQNPPRVAPRHLLDLGIGADNLFHTDRTKVRVRFSVINLTNKEALYNFLSTFSGTHFVTPRAYQVQLGVTF
jgi:carboxypeptidase family protein